MLFKNCALSIQLAVEPDEEIVAVSLPLPFPGRNLGKVASLASLCKSHLTDDSHLLLGGERKRTSWRQRQGYCGEEQVRRGVVPIRKKVRLLRNSRVEHVLL